MRIYAFNAFGFDGQLITVEADIRRGLPGTEIIGLPNQSIKEAKERVRVALIRSGFEYPKERILINLSPAGIRKGGASYDLAIAIALLIKSGQIAISETQPFNSILCVGELSLDGSIRGLDISLAAILTGKINHVPLALISDDDYTICNVVQGMTLGSAHTLRDAVQWVIDITNIDQLYKRNENVMPIRYASRPDAPDFVEVHGNREAKEALQIAVAGGHNTLLYGPPGHGKSLLMRCLPSIFPRLCDNASLESSKIHALAGELRSGLIEYPPYRMPHHSASVEGLIGGGSELRPGEVSLAHHGFLFLDEAPEFKRNVLQGLREPLEERMIVLVRAQMRCWYPADFTLMLAMNSCPCGNLGKNDGSCLCSIKNITSYWSRIGGALLDRIALKVPVVLFEADSFQSAEQSVDSLSSEPSISSALLRHGVEKARAMQAFRYTDSTTHSNGRLTPQEIKTYCIISAESERVLNEYQQKHNLSYRNIHAVLQVARTIADIYSRDAVYDTDVIQALSYQEHKYMYI